MCFGDLNLISKTITKSVSQMNLENFKLRNMWLIIQLKESAPCVLELYQPDHLGYRTLETTTCSIGFTKNLFIAYFRQISLILLVLASLFNSPNFFRLINQVNPFF